MSILKEFLKIREEETKKIIISKRFETPFTIRSISQAENDELSRLSMKKEMVKGQKIERLDSRDYTKRLIVASTIEPNFKDSEMCSFYGVINPLDVPGMMLSVGEYSALADAIMGINQLDLSAQEVVDEAKNS